MNFCVWIIFWISALLGCLQTNSFSIKDLLILDTDFDIKDLEENVKCLPDSAFYTPTNVKSECITAALDCFLTEFQGTVKHECDDPKKRLPGALEFLEIKLKQRTEAGHVINSNECTYEGWQETPFSEFLKNIESLLQLQNTLEDMKK